MIGNDIVTMSIGGAASVDVKADGRVLNFSPECTPRGFPGFKVLSCPSGESKMPAAIPETPDSMLKLRWRNALAVEGLPRIPSERTRPELSERGNCVSEPDAC